MQNLGKLLRRAAGVFLLAVLALVLLNGCRQPGPAPTNFHTRLAPTVIPTAACNLTDQPYPPPSDASIFDRTPRYTLHGTPLSVSELPVLTPYPPPDPFHEMRLVYAGGSQPGFWVTDLSDTIKLRWPSWPDDQASGEPTEMMRVSPDGSKILYSLWCSGPGCDPKLASIWTMNPDGSGKRRLVAAAEDWFPVDAIWSPDGKHIAYRVMSRDPITLMPTSRELWVMNADGSQPRRVLSDDKLLRLGGEAPAYLFRWMGNGYIYFAGESLYAVNPKDGSLFRLIDKVDALGLSFSLSPDGRHAWGRTDELKEGLLAAGFQIVELPSHSVDGAIWSGDGSQMAYVARPESSLGGGARLWLHDLSSGKERPLLGYPLSEGIRLLSFSPDGRYLAYEAGSAVCVLGLAAKGGQTQESNQTPSAFRNCWAPASFISWIPIQ
jgi:hypothetical protein